MEALSQYKSQVSVDFTHQSTRIGDVFARNRYVHTGVGKKIRPPSKSGRFYENALSKDSLMKRTDVIVPNLSRQVGRTANMIHHDYAFDGVDIVQDRKWVAKRSPQPITIAKSLGRDNFMYKVSEGFNLDPKDKTYFDKYNILDVLEATRSLTSLNNFNSGNSTREVARNQSKTTLQIIKRTTEQLKKERRVQQMSDDSEAEHETNEHAKLRYKKSTMAKGLPAFDSNELRSMSLEEKILQGVFKA